MHSLRLSHEWLVWSEALPYSLARRFTPLEYVLGARFVLGSWFSGVFDSITSWGRIAWGVFGLLGGGGVSGSVLRGSEVIGECESAP